MFLRSSHVFLFRNGLSIGNTIWILWGFARMKNAGQLWAAFQKISTNIYITHYGISSGMLTRIVVFYFIRFFKNVILPLILQRKLIQRC